MTKEKSDRLREEFINIYRIPRGDYCYELDKKGKFIRNCPFWNLTDDKPEQNNGYCSFLKIGDWEHEGLGFLWDQLKECNINMGVD